MILRIIYDRTKVISCQEIGTFRLPHFMSKGIYSMDEEPEVAKARLDAEAVDTRLLQAYLPGVTLV